MSNHRDTPKESWEEEFDKRWPNLYTFVPSLGEGDAIRAMKDFIRKVRTQDREALIQRLERLAQSAMLYSTEDEVRAIGNCISIIKGEV